MRTLPPILVTVLLVLPAAAFAQGLGNVGSGPSTTFTGQLPSTGVSQRLGGSLGSTGPGQFFSSHTGRPADLLASRSIRSTLERAGYLAISRRLALHGTAPGRLTRLSVRTIESLNFERRARFAHLRSSMFALAERIRQADTQTLGELHVGFRELMVPVPIEPQSRAGYGYFSRLDLVGASSVDPEALVEPFTVEVQKSLGQDRYLDVAQALVTDRPLPEGVTLEQFYDPQLGALANYLFNSGNYPAAVGLWETLVNRDPTDARRQSGLALGLLANAQFRRAAEAARESLRLWPGWPDGLQLTGSNFQDVFARAGDLVDLRAELTTQLDARPDDADLQFAMAWLDLFQGRIDAAADRLDAIQGDPVAASLAARLRAGAAAESIRRPATSVLREISEDLTGLEEAALSAEDRAALAEALREGPNTYSEWMRLGDYRFFMGDYTRASEMYRAAHKANPEDPFALFALVHASFANGEYRLAARYLRRALALEPNWGLYEFRLPEFYGSLDEFRRHVANLERQVQIRSGVVAPKFLLAYVYYFSGRYADAADLLVEVTDQEPDFERADALLRLARLQG